MKKNLINEVLSNEGMSINQLSQKLGLTYANTHALVNREDLTDTKLGTLVDVSKILDVEVGDLFEISLVDPYDFREVKILEEAIEEIQNHSHTSGATDKANQELYRLVDIVEEIGKIDYNILNDVKKEILDAAKYAGYTNIQHNLISDVKGILRKLDYTEIDTHFNKETLSIICRENGGDVEYEYDYFKEEFEEWANDLDIVLADTSDLERYLKECGYNVVEIEEKEN